MKRLFLVVEYWPNPFLSFLADGSDIVPPISFSFFSVDDSITSTGINHMEGAPPTSYISLHTTGVLNLKKGSKVSVGIYSQDTGSYTFSSMSSFGMVALPSTVGFTADLFLAIPVGLDV